MSLFSARHGRAAEACGRAPGRVNLLGEHTDYNEGWVLPLAIPQQTVVEVARADDGINRLYAVQLDETAVYAGSETPAPRFAHYVEGCLAVLRAHGQDVPPLHVVIDSAVPIGVGLSSSAALEVATLRAVRDLLSLPLDDVTLALYAHEAEIAHAGVRCGVMDQFASSLARTDRALLLDTRTLQTRLLPLPAGSQVLVVDSGVHRELANTAYNTRRLECEAAAAALGVSALRDVADPARLVDLPPPLDRRARHVFTENARVLRASGAVDAAEFGRLMNESHASLRDDFEVSVPALDRLVDLLVGDPRVYGARLTGAGFGGACVALVREDTALEVGREVIAGGPVQGAAVLVPPT